MPHIHAVPGPRRSPAARILLVIVLLLIIAAIAWYFIAGPGKSQVNIPKPGMVGQLLPGALHLDWLRAIQQVIL